MYHTKGSTKSEISEAEAHSPANNNHTNHTLIVEVNAAYNRERLPMPKPNGSNGKRVLDLEMLMQHPFYWDWLNERETEEAMMEIYIARTRRGQ